MANLSHTWQNSLFDFQNFGKIELIILPNLFNAVEGSIFGSLPEAFFTNKFSPTRFQVLLDLISNRHYFVSVEWIHCVAGVFFLECSVNVIARRTRCLRDFSAFFLLDIRPSKTGSLCNIWYERCHGHGHWAPQWRVVALPDADILSLDVYW